LKISRSTPGEKESLLSSSTTTTSKVEPMIRLSDYSQFTDYMHIDGFLLFRLIAHNTDEMVAGQIIEHLYRNYEPPTRNYTSNV